MLEKEFTIRLLIRLTPRLQTGFLILQEMTTLGDASV